MKQSNVKIAITGGIGSGKSTVSEIIKNMGYAVFSCDEIYSELLKDPVFIAKICSVFGDVKTLSGELDRSKLSAIVFNDKEKLNLLNEITHPKIMEIAISRASGEGLNFVEVPLLFENGFQSLFDGVIVVLRNISDRVESVSKRDNINKVEVENRIKNQYNYDICDFAMYYVIHNNGNLSDLDENVKGILQLLKDKYQI